jgi:membrane protease subunit HflK
MPGQDDDPQSGPQNTNPKPGSQEICSLLRQGRERLRDTLPNGRPSARVLGLGAVIAIVAIGAWSSIYTVPSDSVAIA